MQNHENNLVKTKYTYENQEYIITNKCPHCNLDIYPLIQSTYHFENNSHKITALSLSCPSCKKDYFILNDFGESTLPNEGNKYILSIPQYTLVDNLTLKNTSRKFQNVYMQSVNSELLGYMDISFFGYIKALEILVKEIAILQYPESEDVILFSNLISCLEQFHSTNMHLFSKKLLDVLKNDYLFFYKSEDYQSSTQLVKDCINYFLLYLELLLKTFKLNNEANNSSSK